MADGTKRTTDVFGTMRKAADMVSGNKVYATPRPAAQTPTTRPTNVGVPQGMWTGGMAPAQQAAPQQSPYGSQSGPGILESWFNQRANGTDPAYEYAMQRGGDAIDTRMAAGGSFNSGARGQQQSDFAANMAAQRMGQLDALAGGASGEQRAIKRVPPARARQDEGSRG
jgi:hypothetical protein